MHFNDAPGHEFEYVFAEGQRNENEAKNVLYNGRQEIKGSKQEYVNSERRKVKELLKGFNIVIGLQPDIYLGTKMGYLPHRRFALVVQVVLQPSKYSQSINSFREDGCSDFFLRHEYKREIQET
jgi:hypothetical protein